MTYFIYINGKDFEVCGCEAAYEAFRKACDFGGMVGALVALVDGETGEVLADNEEDDLGIPMPEPEDLTEPWWEG